MIVGFVEPTCQATVLQNPTLQDRNTGDIRYHLNRNDLFCLFYGVLYKIRLCVVVKMFVCDTLYTCIYIASIYK